MDTNLLTKEDSARNTGTRGRTRGRGAQTARESTRDSPSLGPNAVISGLFHTISHHFTPFHAISNVAWAEAGAAAARSWLHGRATGLRPSSGSTIPEHRHASLSLLCIYYVFIMYFARIRVFIVQTRRAEWGCCSLCVYLMFT